VLTVMDILKKTNDRAKKGILWDTDGNGAISSAEQTLRNLANGVFTAINEKGDIT